MNSLNLIKYTRIRQIPAFVIQSARLCDQKSPGKQDENESNKVKSEKKPENVNKKSDSAAEKLNQLLASMKADENSVLLKKLKPVDIPKAGGRKKDKVKDQKEVEEVKREQKSKDIIQAAKDVANLMGEDKKKVESELLSKLLNHSSDVTSESNTTKGAEKPTDLKDIISGMKIDNNVKRDQSRAEYVRKTISIQKQRLPYQKQFRGQQSRITDSHGISGSINLFGEEPLGIFTKNVTLNESTDCLEMWKKLEEKELKLAITHPPKNYFEKMALWTEQGKLWHFPINNEQGLEAEEKVDFSEHVFLEQHLEPWCPRKGPIRHFMELVCVGLSKNPYITVQDKKDHIFWYRDYFEQKKDILKETIVQQSEEKQKSEQKQLKS